MFALRSIFLLLILLALGGLCYGNESNCGVRISVNSRIVGGEESSAGKWPWQVLFQIILETGYRASVCGGTLIANRWIVTAAHCTHERTAPKLHMFLGTFKYLVSEDATRKEFPVAKIIQHPDYDDDTIANDISLLLLGGTVTFTDYILPACLPSQGVKVEVDLDCWISGWGNTEVATESRFTLREASVPIISNADCETWYNRGSSFNISSAQVCAGFESGGVDTCQGDSGGPLVCQLNSTLPFQLEGITSFGIGCAEPNYPGVYTRVSEYVSWIENEMQRNSDADPFFSLPQTACGTTITSNQTLRLPVDSETQLYAPAMTCTWILQPSSTTTNVTITFLERIGIESGCYDILKIVGNTGVQIGSNICGFDLPMETYIPAGSYESVNLTFESDSSVQFVGFAVNISFTSTSVDEPHTTTTSTSTATSFPPSTYLSDSSTSTATLSTEIITSATTSTAGPTSSSPLYPGCGLSSSHEGKIVGGVKATLGKLPWQAALQETSPTDGSQSIICGGTLINEKWVISATHCTKGTEAQYFHVILGTVDYNDLGALGKKYPVSKIVNHPDYITASKGDDISLLKIGASIAMSEYILPACLPSQGVDVTVGLNCTISGWGNTEVFSDNPNLLREAVVPIISNAVCSSWYFGQLVHGIIDVHLCAGYENGGVDTCQGDSGGPLVCQASSTAPYQLEGITSFGIGCADARNPGVYTRVSEYVSWIEETIQTDPGTEPFFALPQTPCGSVISTNQTLRLPVDKETQLYGTANNCPWTLKTNGYGILLKFVERFTLEGDFLCYDYITITSDTGRIIQPSLCGYTLPNDVIISPGLYDSVIITFKSDFSIQHEGFAVKVSFQKSFPATTTTATTQSTSGGSNRYLSGRLPFVFSIVAAILSVEQMLWIPIGLET